MEEKSSSGWKKAIFISLIVFLICFSYAFIRYNIVRNVSFEHLPLYITNKAIALTATILIGLSFLIGPLTHFFPKVFSNSLSIRKNLGLTGFGVAAIHAFMSLLLFNKINYPKFFLQNEKLNFIGEITMLFGILAFFIFLIMSIIAIPSIEEKLTPQQWRTMQRLGYIAYGFVLLHVSIMGWKGWFQADSWQYGLASITLVASLFIILILVLRFLVIIIPQKKIKNFEYL